MKAVMSIAELVAEGFPETELRQIAHSEIFPELGFRGEKRKSKIYFYTGKLQKYLERRTEWQYQY